MTAGPGAAPIPTPSALLFDLDDTLVPDHSAVRAAALDVGQQLGAPVGLVDTLLSEARRRWYDGPFAGWFRLIGTSSWEGLWAPLLGAGHRQAAIRAWAPGYRCESWAAALGSHGLNPALAESAAELFVERRRAHCGAFPDVLPALDALRARGHRTAVVTNGMSDLQWLKFSLAGLEPYFDAFVASSAVGIGKPDPRVFEVALVRIGAQAADAVMIGDNPIRDIAGACRAGMRTVWLDREGGDNCGVEPDLRITSLAELPPGVSPGR